jgi:outer membrane protein, adhesin transport system
MKLRRQHVGLVVAFAALSGCMNSAGDADGLRLEGVATEAKLPIEAVVDKAVARKTGGSEIIEALRARPSLLIPGTPYAFIAEAVMLSDSRVAEAELQVAILRADAARQNWMPRIGPRASLSALGDLVADLMLQQVLFDNGRKTAERDLARADVEIAAITIVEAGNERVFEALSLYLEAEENRELRNHLERSLREMGNFEWVIQKRVDGGVSDMSDLNVLQQQLASIRARAGEAAEVTTTALAQLNMISARQLDGLIGLGGLRNADTGPALPVLRAKAERDRTVAKARIARASHLPALAANASTDGEARLEMTTDSFFGVGSGAAMDAIEATKKISERRIAEADESMRRQIGAQTRAITSYRRQSEEARGLTASAQNNLQLFMAQFESGHRQVMDLVGTYEIYARAMETEIALKYKVARAELQLARLMGALAEGARI